ncbi:DUF6221 family protein [Nocardiopsis tropica]|uniref:DUF6221 family protein n=1 Tax=Nocardiopsis tropica TaxID=109330 RepID=A0ABU7KZM3_9ACTN|nr:DUF6221 family protein [Nocardiopsis umidischolae]MEE2054758.1 DUF6221 family protein [Nocardiopsis umidischolae]
MTIVEFINARLDEEERVAKDAASSLVSLADQEGAAETWEADTDSVVTMTGVSGMTRLFVDAESDVTTHIARHDPARVLREIAAKRAIVQEYTDAVDLWERESEAPDSVGALEAVIRLLAAVHADHPDYRQEWAP